MVSVKAHLTVTRGIPSYIISNFLLNSNSSPSGFFSDQSDSSTYSVPTLDYNVMYFKLTDSSDSGWRSIKFQDAEGTDVNVIEFALIDENNLKLSKNLRIFFAIDVFLNRYLCEQPIALICKLFIFRMWRSLYCGSSSVHPNRWNVTGCIVRWRQPLVGLL